MARSIDLGYSNNRFGFFQKSFENPREKIEEATKSSREQREAKELLHNVFPDLEALLNKE
ncbi:Uncharacterised protein (plasmid) [Legionella adelaidensis]|uniref:Uncharacterized protein n=1 Tax=Legionella adelaidensis TaxID=45056 RepID=A0A0W0R5B9_9GAMM|nr:hypothetical protein [Legionella adelaidensis]KTC66287.1 hypothetical protein Lade_0945 [Legionella adelaidensis]VEH84883.1 Uncharacterised protein [Legionella adelaidensis]